MYTRVRAASVRADQCKGVFVEIDGGDGIRDLTTNIDK